MTTAQTSALPDGFNPPPIDYASLVTTPTTITSLLDVIKAHIMLGTVGNTLPALARPGQKNMDKKLITEFLLNAMTYVPKPPKTVPVRLVAYRRHVNALRDMLATHVTAPQAVSLSMCLLEQLLREAIKEKEDQACAAHDSDSDDVYDD